MCVILEIVRIFIYIFQTKVVILEVAKASARILTRPTLSGFEVGGGTPFRKDISIKIKITSIWYLFILFINFLY